MSFSDFVAEDRRLSILKLLEVSDGYSANEFLLGRGLESLAHNVSADLLRNECGWLEEQGLVKVEIVQGVTIVTLTERGGDVAAGKARVQGVKKPKPGR